MTPRRFVFACAVAVVAVATSCSDDGEVSTTTTVSAAASSTSIPATSSMPDPLGSSTTASEPSAPAAISVAVYWTRPYGTPPPIDIPAYQDPPDGPFPYVLFGAVTNTGDATEGEIGVEWVLDGATIHTQTARMSDPQGNTMTSLAPGATADLIVVVDDEAAATQLVDAVPTFEVLA